MGVPLHPGRSSRVSVPSAGPGGVPRPYRIRPEWGIALVAAVLYWIVSFGLIDDTYITLTYARNLATHAQWGMVPGEVANTATSPLNVMVLAAVIALLRPVIGVQPLIALGLVFVVSNIVLTTALRRTALGCGLPAWPGVLGAALVLVNPLVLSTVGLEMSLASALLGLALWAAVRVRPALFGITSGLLVLTRIDLAIFAVLLALGTSALRRRVTVSVLAALAVSLPWFVFSWRVLGSAVPDTLLIKQLQDYWGDAVFGNGLGMYLGVFPVAVILSLLAPLLGLALLPVWTVRRMRGCDRARNLTPVAALGIAALCHYAAYVALGVPPYHWYYAPGIIGATVALALLWPGMTGPDARRVVLAGTALLLVTLNFLTQRGVPWEQPPIATNGATSAEYARIGRAVGRAVGDAGVRSPGEIGALAYYCECAIFDEFSDRGYLPEKIEERKREVGPLTRWLIEWNYANFDTDSTSRPTEFGLRRENGLGADPMWNGTSSFHDPAHFVLERE